jgi:nucleotide-binding universal stress UspA family protein
MHVILAATDGSPSADRAVDFASALANAFRAKLILVNVMPIEFRVTFDANFKPTLDAEELRIVESLESNSQTLLAQAKKRIEANGLPGIDTVSRLGDPAETLLAIAAEQKDPVIVLGKHGHGRFAELLLGSMPHKLALHATCPVIVVP